MDRTGFNPGITGLCMAVFYLVPSSRVRGLIPPQLSVIDVLPGLTLGGVYAACFPQDSGTALNEFGVMPSYVRYGSRKGYFLQNFCADSGGKGPGMMHEGRDCGNTDFVWEFNNKSVRLDIRADGVPVIGVKMSPLIRHLPISSCFHFMSVKGDNVLFFRNRLASSIGISLTSLNIPDSSPLSGFPLRYKLVSTYWEPSNVVWREPETLPSRAIRRTDEAFGSHMSRGVTVHKNETESCLR